MSKSKKELHSTPESDNICINDTYANTFIRPILNNVYVIVINIGNITYKIIHITISLYGIYFIWTMIHFFASHLYIKLCVPFSFAGLIISPFMLSTPHCQGLRWLIINGANMINNMWLIIGSWVSSILLITR